MNNELKKILSGSLREYGSVPFWSWNSSLDENELCRQIEEMKSVGIEGFIMHARTGLKDEYLGEKWFSCIDACLKKARELDMDAWVYDENGWPSGFVGGKLLDNPDFLARFLEYKEGYFDGEAYGVYVADDKKGFVRVSSPIDGVTVYHNVYLRVSPANTDILNPAVTEAFIRETHEGYYKRFKESFGRELVGFFTDEPQYYRWATPYSPCAEPAFTSCGEDIRDGLIWLFKDDERGYAFRTKYYGTLNKLYVENFYKKIYDWCHEHNCKLTGHSVEEGSLGMQMWGGAAVMPTYEYEDIPGIDWLGRFCCDRDLEVKQVASVSAQLGKNRILTETYGCSGYDVTPFELKSIADFQYFQGVNVMCQHLYPYSVAGRGRTDHPPVFGRHGNWMEGFKVFNEYFKKLAYIISNTKENCRVAVIHPERDVWLNFNRDIDQASVQKQDDDLYHLMAYLRKYGVAYQFADETILAKYGRAENGKLIIGECEYDTVIVPETKTIASTTYDILKKYTGKLCVLSDIGYIDGVKAKVELKANITLDGIKSEDFVTSSPDCVISRRSGSIGDFIFLKNASYYNDGEVELKGVADKYRALDLVTLEEKNISDKLTLKKSEGLVLIKDEAAESTVYTQKETDVTADFAYTDIGANYLVIDYARISKNGVEYSDNRPISSLFEDLLREDYKGKIYVRYEFKVNDIVPVKLIMERAKVLSATVNGKSISFGKNDFDVNYAEADISFALQKGENVFEYSFEFYQHDGVYFALFDPLATESLRNCLYYDTSIESIYLKGEFCVNSDRSISEKRKPSELTDKLFEQGYPFFKGEAVVKGKITKPQSGRVLLDLRGRFMTANVKIAGNSRLFAMSAVEDITDMLSSGENDVEIVIRSSMRNIFGPHHFRPVAEPFGVSPYNFEFRGCWKDGKANDYTDDYNFVPFGLSQIVLVNEK